MLSNISISVLLGALIAKSTKEGLMYRSILVALFIDSVAGCLMLAGFYLDLFDSFALETVIFCFVMLYLVSKDYQMKSDKYDSEKINVLLYRPKTTFEVIKAFIGIPVSSLCLSTQGKVWAFRKRSGRFERAEYSEAWEASHIIVRTRIKPSKEIIDRLDSIVGESRYPQLKCVWSVREVLKMMGKKYEVKNPLGYIPGIYAQRLKGGA